MSDSADNHRPLARSDLWAGMVFAVLGTALVVESWRMPRLEERGIDPWTVPGIVPGLLGLALAVLGIALAIRGWRQGRGQIHHASIMGTGAARVRLVTALALNLIFALLLVGWLPFWLATFVYFTVFMATFMFERDKSIVQTGALILVVATGATAGIVYLFETLFLVRLP